MNGEARGAVKEDPRPGSGVRRAAPSGGLRRRAEANRLHAETPRGEECAKEASESGVHSLVLAPDRLDGVVLLEDQFFLIRSVGRVVWCHLLIPKNTPPSAGADAAKRLGKYLLENVLLPRSSWLGLIVDVRKGPTVFGPITRELNAKLFVAAERARKPLAVVTIGEGAQHSQFCELAAQAPHFGLVTSSVDKAVDWMTMAH